ncbi:hypothetical protein RWD71_26775, partial [Klebsiella pneumoniae]|uniref:hypothetical protein n=1 Tax=Klebsiella pneumoniae TaxID=573 RepID=UPI002935B78D
LDAMDPDQQAQFAAYEREMAAMRGRGATPSMGLSQFRGGRYCESDSESDSGSDDDYHGGAFNFGHAIGSTAKTFGAVSRFVKPR